MRLICWNVAGRIKKLPRQVAALAKRKPDIVALQEVTKSNGPLLRAHFPEIGLPYIADTVDEAIENDRRYAVLIASRWPLEDISRAIFPVPWPERIVSVQILHPKMPFALHNTYIPTGATKAGGEFKLATLEGLFIGLAQHSNTPRILCGDFNAPQSETADGTLITFGQNIRPDGTVYVRRSIFGLSGARWDQAERGPLEGLAAFDLGDVYRRLNGYKVQDYSWYAKNRGRMFGFRLDHIFAAESLNPVACQYLHELRETGLSDHAPLEADFAL
ncbi:MAG: endonuclease/exonuclease/phosphatase family protein [Chloroflexota bacterium]